MFFVNFICVFYLMVLCKGHTISNAKSDNIYDTNEYPDGRDFKQLLESNASNVTAYLENKYFKKHDNKEAIRTQPENFDDNFTEYTTEVPNDESTNFWYKFTKNSKSMLDNDINYYVKQDYSSDKKSRSNIYLPYLSRGYNNNYDYNDQLDTKVNKHKGKHKYFGLHRKRQHRRAANVENDKMTVRITLQNKFFSAEDATKSEGITNKEKCVTIDADKSKTPSGLNTKTTKSYLTPFLNISHDEMNIGTINDTEFRIKNYTDYTSKFTHTTTKPGNTIDKTETKILSTTTLEPEITSLFGTAEMETLIDELKKRAMAFIINNNPTIANIISSSVTAATYNANSPSNLSTIDMKYSTESYSQTDLLTTDLESNISDATIKHNRVARTVTSTIAAIPQSIARAENKVESGIKGMYKKWKTKLKCDFKHEVTQTKNFVNDETYKIVNKVSQTIHPSKKMAHLVKADKNDKFELKSHSSTMPTRISNSTIPHRTFRSNVMKPKNNILRSTEKLDETSTKGAALEDDYVMLTLYEQMLNKERENYFTNLLTTDENINDRRQEINSFIRELKKRQLDETSDYNIEESTQQDMPSSQSDSDEIYASTESYQSTENNVETPMTATSYEDLSNKISYKDYVNGYKHYLNFQKQLADQNFSAQIRYQAHRHHSVDDIGKYILDKIPEIPNLNRSKRAPADYLNAKDYSWLRKHLKFLYEANSPKKFHTSETVTLKLPTTAPISKSTESKARVQQKSDNKAIRESVITITEDAHLFNDQNKDRGVDLDKLSEILEASKSKHFDNEVKGTESTTPLSTSKVESRNYSATRGEDSFFTGNVFNKWFKFSKPSNDKEHSKTSEEVDNSQLINYIPITYSYVNDDSNVKQLRVKRSQYPMQNDYSDVKYVTTSPYTEWTVSKFSLPVTHVKQRQLTTTKKKKFRRFFNIFKSKKSPKKGEEKKSKAKRHLEQRVTRFCPFKKLRYWLTCNTKKENIVVSSSMKPSRSDTQLFKSDKYNDMSEVGDQMSINISDFKFKPNDEPDYSASPNDHYVFDWNDFAKDPSPQLDSFEEFQNSVTNTIPWTSSPNRYFLEHDHDIEDNFFSSMAKDLTSIFDLTKPTKHRTTKFTTDYLKFTNANKLPNSHQDSAMTNNYESNKFSFNASNYTNSPYTNEKKYDFASINQKNKSANVTSLKTTTMSPITPPYYDIKLSDNESVNTDKSTSQLGNNNLYYNFKKANQKPSHYQLRGLSDVNFYSIPKIQNSINIDKLYNDHFVNTESSTETSFNNMFPHDKIYTITPPPEAILRRFPTKNTNKPTDTEFRNKIKQSGDDIPDYFNELLVWHGDLLHDDNSQTLSNWRHMYTKLMSTQNNNYTPNLMSIENEVNDMKLFLNKINDSPVYDKPTTETLQKESIKEQYEKVTTVKIYSDETTPTPTQKVTTKNFQKRKYTKPTTNDMYTRRFYLKSEHEILQFKSNTKDQSNNKYKIHMYEHPLSDIHKDHTKPVYTGNMTNSYKFVTTTSINKLKTIQENQLPNSNTDAFDKLLNDSTNIAKTMNNYKFKSTQNARYTSKYDQARHANSNTDSKKEAEFDKLLLDTTLLAYDDGLSFLMKTNQQKAKKHHVGAVTYGKKDSQNAQINKPQTHPAQYFSTPLPMRSADFEQFLREHSLDVNSVTSSISNAKTYVDTWSNTKTPENNKFTSKITTDMTKSKGECNSNHKNQETSVTTSETEKMNTELNKLDNSLHIEHYKHYKRKEFKEKAATNKFDYMNYLASIDNGVTKRSKSFKKIKRKMGMFHKKTTVNKNVEDAIESIDLKDSPVEITVITLNDAQGFQNDNGERSIYNENKNKSPRQSTTITFSDDDDNNSEESPYISIDSDHEEIDKSKDLRYARKHSDGTHKFKPIKAVIDSFSSKVDSTPKFVENKEISEKNNVQKANNVKESVQTTVLMDNKTTVTGKTEVSVSEKSEPQLDVNKGKLQTAYTLMDTNTDTTKPHRHGIIKGFTENIQHVFNLKHKTKSTTDISTWSDNENTKTQVNELKSRDSRYQYDGILDDLDSSKISFDYDYIPNKRYLIDIPETSTGPISDLQFDSETNQDIKQIMTIADVIEAIENVTRPNVMIHIDLPIYYAPESRPTNTLMTYSLKQQSEKPNITYYNTLNSALMELLNRLGWFKIPVTEKTEGNIIFSNSLYLMLLDFINKICLRAPVANLTDGFNNSDFNSDEVFRESRDGSDLMDYSRKDEHKNNYIKDLPVTNTWKSFPTKTSKAVFIYDLKNIESSTAKNNDKSRQPNVDYFDTTKESANNHERHRRHDNNTIPSRFIAKDVSGFEVIVDLINNSQSANYDNTFQNTDVTLARQSKKENGNSIQVHIALPYIMELNSREIHKNGTLSLPKCIRKIFSAKLSTDVDLEFQVYTYADATTSKSINNKNHDLKELYNMLVTDITSSPPFLKQTDINKSFQSGISQKLLNLLPASENYMNDNIDDKELIRKGIDDINKQLLKLYENLTAVAAVINGKNIAPRNTKHEKEVFLKLLHDFIISNSTTKNLNKYRGNRKARNLKCKAMKKIFSNDRVCCCKCRANKTMCRACAASDAVITEIIFEFDNLSEYMKSHCTEIQTYFFMNPTGGRRLKDSVHRLDKVLNDYYKRVKGKCQGPTCKSLAGMQPLVNKNKRSIDNQSLSDFITSLQTLSSNVKLLLESDVNDKIARRTKCFLIEAKKCFHIPTNKIIDKYDWSRKRRQSELQNVYSVDKFNVNILTYRNRSKDASENKNKLASTEEYTTTLQYSRYFSNTSSPYRTQPESLRDYENIDEVTKNSINKLVILRKWWPHIFSTRAENLFTFTEKLYPEETLGVQSHKLLDRQSAHMKKSNKKTKRDLEVQPTQLETPLITDPGGTFWYNYLSKNMIEDVTAKVMLSQINNKALNNTKSTTESVKPTKQKNKNLKTSQINQIHNATQSTKKHIIHKIPNVDEDFEITKNDSLTMYKLYDLISELGGLINVLSSTYGVINEGTTSIVPKQSTTENLNTSKDRNLKTSPLSYVTEDTNHNKESTVSPDILYDGSKLFMNKCNKKKLKKEELKKEKCTPVDIVKDTKKVFNVTIVHSTKPTEKHSSHATINKDKINYTVLKVDINEDDVFGNKHESTNNNKYNWLLSYNAVTTPIIKSSTISTTEYVYPIDREENELPPDDTNLYPEFEEGNNDINNTLKNLQEPFDDVSEIKSNKNINLLKQYGLNEKYEEQIKHVDDKYHDLFISILNHAAHDDQDTVSFTHTTTPATFLPYDALLNTPTKDENIDLDKWQKITPSIFVREVTTTKKKCPKKYHKMLKTHLTTPPHSSSKPTHPAVINEMPTTTPTTTTKTTAKPKEKETFDPAHPPPATLCDLQVTHDHVLEKYRTMKKDEFCLEAKHIDCFKSKPAPSNLIIEQECSKKICKRKPEDVKPLKVFHEEPKTKRLNGLRFDWIRRKRSLLSFKGYDTYVRDKYGIYRSSTSKKSRTKRRTDLSRLYDGLRNLPSFDTEKDVMHVLIGDTVTLHCNIDPKCLEGSSEFSEFVWSTDRPGMLKMDNIAVESTSMSITSVNVKNDGEYNCTKHGAILRRIKLTVISLPKFHIVFIPTYNTGEECHYDDLVAVSSNLAPEMSTIACARQCSIRIDEPVCMKEEDEKTALRVIAIMTAKPHFNVKCSPECLRDLHSSFTLLCASNIPPLMDIGLVIAGTEKNRSFPVFYVGDSKLIVTHTLRRKDSNQHHEYHKLVSRMQPGDIDVVTSCPTGFELLPKYKICVACPVNTYAIEGANRCSPCAPGSKSTHPGSGECFNVLYRRRRYDWVVKVPLGYSIACGAVIVLCAVGLVGGMASQCSCRGGGSGRSNVKNKILLMEREKGSLRKRLQANPVLAPPRQAKRPLSPSKVILARFFRSSHTSRATDSQETKFGLWRGNNSAPPIPPIDFD